MSSRTPTNVADPSAQAAASSAHARINVPINLDNWRRLPEAVTSRLMWLHQYVLDEKIGWAEAAEALGYDDKAEGQSAIYNALKGIYDGDWEEFCERVDGWRKIVQARAGIILTEFAGNPISQLIWAGLDYAVANKSITLIEGESGHGKSIAVNAWRVAPENNHGKSVCSECASVGGIKVFLGELCGLTGGNRNASIGAMRDHLFRSFNPHRILILDEAIRLLPKKATSMPDKLDFVRELHDRTGCAIALIATRRFSHEMDRGVYMFEQVLGRIGMPIRLPSVLEEAHFRPILVQYFPRASKQLLATCEQIANDRLPRQKGRLRLLSQVLRLASRIASKKKTRLAETHFFEALAAREQMMGENPNHAR